MGKSRSTMYVSMLMNAINVAGNALLVYVFKLGVAGVAIPTLVSRAVAAVVMYVMLLNQKHEIHLIRGGYRPDFPMIRRILKIAVPSGVENSLFQLGRVLVVSIISTFGTAQIAANAVANTLDSMGVLLAGAINLAVITVVGQCVGARDFEQVKYYARKLLLIAYAANAVMNGLVLALLNPLLHLFNLSQAAFDLGENPGDYPCGLRDSPVAGGVHTAQQPARDQRRELHDVRGHRLDGGLPHPDELHPGRADGHGRDRCVDRHGDRLDLPLLGLHLALEEREVARLLHGFQDLVGLRETKQTPVCC